MAVFTIAKDDKVIKYKTEDEFKSLIYYCHKNAIAMECFNLYQSERLTRHENLQLAFNQILYHQCCSHKKLNTRALHYIFGVDRKECRDIEVMKNFLSTIPSLLAQDCQKIAFLHKDKETHFDIHIIINPVSLNDYKIHHSSPYANNTLRDIATLIFHKYGMDLLGVSYIGIREGELCIRYGNPKDMIDYEQEKHFDHWKYRKKRR